MTAYVTVLEPYSGEPQVRSLSVLRDDGAIEVIVVHGAGEDRFRLEDDTSGGVSIRRLSPAEDAAFEAKTLPLKVTSRLSSNHHPSRSR